VAVIVAGTAIRLRYALLHQGVIYPDETYQMTEAAHRVVTERHSGANGTPHVTASSRPLSAAPESSPIPRPATRPRR
jgi:hypothetical protein